jgi:hypothetical protein
VIRVQRVLSGSDFSDFGRLIRSDEATASAESEHTYQEQYELAGFGLKKI